MMIFRLIISAFRFLPLVYGGRRCRPSPKPASHAHSSPAQTPVPTLPAQTAVPTLPAQATVPTLPAQTPVPTLPLVPKLDDHTYKHIGYFVYESKVPYPVKMVFVGLPGDVGMFSVECKGFYQSNLFRLHEVEGDPDVIHQVPAAGPERDEHGVWVARAEAACPEAMVRQQDFSYFSVNEGGDLEVSFGDNLVTLSRTWLPLVPGVYSSGDSSEFGVQMQYKISMDGTVDVKLGCADGGDTGFKKYKLVGTGIGKPYMVKPVDDGDTLKDLVDSLKLACPGLTGYQLDMVNYNTVGFATGEVIYVAGEFFRDSLHRQLS
ncbi:hypothetical protein FOZ60_009536 [Perkinsus olseni]|uniref:Uncharacterized protein n=1 Tax=Perkinsus olseni TaxID=32597 RepID=A0A7J6NHD4_PEROL|nr:hypothetical protein FOZ60_009536 [Perkinsus olseni]